MVIFVVLTVILLAITIGGWIAWEKWERIETGLRRRWGGLRKAKENNVV
jgi:hypothetical protein